MRTRALSLTALLSLLLAALPISRPAAAAAAPAGLAMDAELVEMRTEVPKLKAAAEYKVQDNLVEIELSEYAGYAGLIVANGGLAPNEGSVFFKKHGFKLKITLSEEESWSSLNSGRIAASATTVDVLVPYSRQLNVVVPALISFSRGADGIVVRSDVSRINALKGKTLAVCQFTESDFFIRYLAQEAGLAVNMLPDFSAKSDPQKVNLIFCADAFGAGDLFLRDLKAGQNRLAGCVTWEPKTSEVAEGSGGKARILTTNRNLLIVADILILNRAFAQANPRIVAGLVEGLMEGNQKIRENAEPHAGVIAQAFKWKPEDVKSELAKIHFANLPENLAFFKGELDSAGSYSYIYETAGYVYGSELLGKTADSDKFPSLDALKELDKAGTFKNQKASIRPIRSSVTKAELTGEEEALLSKDIKFMFAPNSTKLEDNNKENTKGLLAITQLLKVSPGSRVLLRGHADGSRIEEFRRKGGETKAREARLALKNLSKSRCAEIKQLLQETYKVDAERMDSQGVGADEPTGQGPDADRRVEVQWFMAE